MRIFDPAAPVITLNGEAVVRHEPASEYSDLGATVADADGNVLDAQLIKLTGVVDGGVAGTYTLAYDFTDAEGRPAETVFRTVQVSDTTPPVLTIHGVVVQFCIPLVNPILTLARWRWMQQMVRFPQQVISYEWNTLTIKVFLVTGTRALSIWMGMAVSILERPVGEGKLTGTLYFGNDADFRSANVGIDQNTTYRNLLRGVFHARVDDYRFGLEWPDDRGSFWLDLDRDGVFESEGELGSEWMNAGTRYGYRTISLQPGIYKVAIAHMEGGGITHPC